MRTYAVVRRTAAATASGASAVVGPSGAFAPGASSASISVHSMNDSTSWALNSDSGFAGSVSAARGARASTRGGAAALGDAGGGAVMIIVAAVPSAWAAEAGGVAGAGAGA